MAETERLVVEALKVLLPLGFLAAMIFAPSLLVWLRDRRLLQAIDAPLHGSSCPACEGDAVTTYAADCHRCDLCGMEWGAGRAAHASLQRREALASRPRWERLELAIAELRTAIAHLDAAANALSHGPSDADLVVAAARLAWALGDSMTKSRSCERTPGCAPNRMPSERWSTSNERPTLGPSAC